jgi:hypothetical protein
MIERWFGELTRKRIRRETFSSIVDLIGTINEHIRIHNREPKPLFRVKKVDQILSKITHCQPVIETLHQPRQTRVELDNYGCDESRSRVQATITGPSFISSSAG